MMPFLEGSLRSASQQRRNASIVKSLRRSENLRVREENVNVKDRYYFCVTAEIASASHCVNVAGTDECNGPVNLQWRSYIELLMCIFRLYSFVV